MDIIIPIVMTLKSPHTFSQWIFFMESPTGEEFALQEHTLQKLIDLVVRQIAQFDSQKEGFSIKAREEAESLGLDWRQYISHSIQHQICLRHGGLESGLCWGGKGDKIHAMVKKVDDKIDKAPILIRKVGSVLAKAVNALATGDAVRPGRCRTCGGSRTFRGDKTNLGRAARIK